MTDNISVMWEPDILMLIMYELASSTILLNYLIVDNEGSLDVDFD